LGEVSFETNDTEVPEYNFAVMGKVERPAPVLIDDGSADYGQGGFLDWPRNDGYLFDMDYSVGGSGATATWSFTGLAPGQYQIATTWFPDSNRAAAAPYSINGGTPILIDQTRSPSDFGSNKFHHQYAPQPWEILDTVTITGSTITVTLTDAGVPADRFVIADAVRIVRTDPNVINAIDSFAVINNGDPNYSNDDCSDCLLARPTSNVGGSPSFLDEFQYMPGDDSGDVVTWGFDLTQGIYEVAVAWHPYPDNTTDAEYTISPGVSDFTTFGTVDQTRSALSDQFGNGFLVADGKAFMILDTVTVAALSKSISVSLSDAGGNRVIADAVLVRRLGGLPLVAAGEPDDQSDPNAIITTQDLQPLVTEAIHRWTLAGLTDAQLKILNDSEIVISDLADDGLGMASEFDGVIRLDVNAAGFGWFIDTTPARDEEFRRTDQLFELEALAGRGADGRIDLLTVIVHEMGHLLGLPDLSANSHDVMADALPPSLRRTPTVSVSSGAGHANPVNPLDVNGDGTVAPLDALAIINDLNSNGARQLTGVASSAPYVDTNQDGVISSNDVLRIINFLNSRVVGEGEAASSLDPVVGIDAPFFSPAASDELEQPAGSLGSFTASDAVFASLGTRRSNAADPAIESFARRTSLDTNGVEDRLPLAESNIEQLANDRSTDYQNVVDDLLASLDDPFDSLSGIR